MRVRCPTCRGLGRVPQAFPDGAAIGYCGPNGERVPHEPCQTCGTSGWIEDGRIGKPAHEHEAEQIIAKIKGSTV